MTMVRRIVASLPWHVRKSITEVRKNWRGRKPSYDGHAYSSLAEFPETMVDSEDYMVRSAIAGLRESREQSQKLIHWRRGRGALSHAVGMIGSEVRILDFGGAAGADFNNLLISNPHANVRYHVLDLPKVCEIGRKLWEGEKRITFSPDLPPETDRFDIVYSWGSIQYVPDPLKLIQLFARYKPSVILVIGTAFSDKTFIRNQTNATRPFPHWVLSLSETESAMKNVGYRLASVQAVGENHNVDNFDENYKVSDFASLLFVANP